MNVDTEKDFQDLFFKTLQDKWYHMSESNAERDCFLAQSPSELRCCQQAERGNQEVDVISLAGLACTSVYYWG